MIFNILYIIFWIPLHLVWRVKVVGGKNVPKKGRMIFACNHQTLNDPIIIAGYVHRRFKYMAKAPLFEKKFNNWLLRQIGAFPVHNKEIDVSAVKVSLKTLKDDKALCVFPEGRRIQTAESNELKNGVAMFALKTKSPIVPAMFLQNTLAFRSNTLVIGEPFMLSDMPEFEDKKIDKELLNVASNVIRNKMNQVKSNYYLSKRTKVENKYKSKIAKLEYKKYKNLATIKNEQKYNMIECVKNMEIDLVKAKMLVKSRKYN